MRRRWLTRRGTRTRGGQTGGFGRVCGSRILVRAVQGDADDVAFRVGPGHWQLNHPGGRHLGRYGLELGLAALNPLLVAPALEPCSDKERTAVAAIDFSIAIVHSGRGDPSVRDQPGMVLASGQTRGDLR